VTDESGFERVEPYEARNVREAWDEVDWGNVVDDAELELISAGIVEQSEERARDYLYTYGDAIWTRVSRAMDQAEGLLVDGRPEASLAFSAIAAELTIRFLLVRPLLGGIIFSDALAERVSGQVVTGRTTLDRQLLPLICQHWDLDTTRLRLSDGSPLIDYLTSSLWTLRNNLVHRGATVEMRDAERAQEAVRMMVEVLVAPVAQRLRFTWPSASWASRASEARSPF
jgi:hypothetical protein